MAHRHEYDTYRRGNAIISLRDQQNMPHGFSLEAVKRRIRDTLDIIPESHINIFGTGGNIRLGSMPRTGGGHDPNIPHIRLSYDCFDGSRKHSYNNGRLSYTLLHEMGHIVDKSINPTCMDVLKTDFPLGCLAMLYRYHGGRTVGPSEHYADIYADYFYNELHGIYYVVNRNDGQGCKACQGERAGRCVSWRPWLSRRIAANGETLPSGSALTSLRYEALFRSPPFRMMTRATAQNLYIQSHPSNETDLLGISCRCSYRVPQIGPTTTSLVTLAIAEDSNST